MYFLHPRYSPPNTQIHNENYCAHGYLVALTATALWSTTIIFIGYLTAQLRTPPLVLAFWRNLFVTIALSGTLALVTRPQLRLERRNVSFVLLHGFVLAVFNGLWMASVALNGAAVAAVLAYSSPAFTALIGWRWWGERLSAPKIGAVISSTLGCALVSGAYSPAAWRVNPLGIAVGLATGALFAVYSILGHAQAHFSGKQFDN